MPESAAQTLDSKPELYRPDLTHCSKCQTPVLVYKTTEGRTVFTLTGPRYIAEVQTYCPNEDCPGVIWEAGTGKALPLVFKSSQVMTFVLPKMKYGLDVILEVGTRFKTDPKPGKYIQKEIAQQYGLDIPLSTLYRPKNYYESLCLGALAENQASIRAQLQQQLAYVLILDATEQKGSMKLYRAIDARSGVCLGTRLLPEKNKVQLLEWRHQLYHTYGVPDYIVSDREDALQIDPTQEPAIPQQICWSHVLKDIWKTLFKSWRSKASSFLRKIQYRKKINAILQILNQIPAGPPTPVDLAVRELLQVFLTKLPGRATFFEPIHDRLKLFSDALTVVNLWINALKGVKCREYADSPLFQTYRHYQTQFTPVQWTHWVQDRLPNQDPVIQALTQLQQFLQDICRQKRFKSLLREFKTCADEFLTLRSWLLEAQLRRLDENGAQLSPPQTPGELHFQTQLRQRASQLEAKLQAIPRKWRAWQWRGPEPDVAFALKAVQTLRRIIARWSRKHTYRTRFQNAAQILIRHFDGLRVFLQHIAIPATNQLIETDNGRIKRLWRRSSGSDVRGYCIDYHGESDSATLNFHGDLLTASPLEQLGFTREELTEWLRKCPLNRFREAYRAMEAARQPRRNVLRARRLGLKTVFQSRARDFLKYGKDLFATHLRAEGT